MAYFDHEPLVIGDLIIPTAVVQGGMGIGVSLAGLASAVANEGGLGVLSAVGVGMLRKETLSAINNITAIKEEIRLARSKTDGVLGINIMVALSDFGDMVKASVEEGIDVIFSGAGLPLNLPSYVGKGCKTKLVPIISSARAAKSISRWWLEKYNYVPDGFVVEGPMAGGHLGFKTDLIDNPDYQLEKLIPEVLEAVRPMEEKCGHKIPVIAAGGIFTGADIKRFLKMGAAGVQMATRFVATDECDADIAFKNAYVQCEKEDIGIIISPVGMPGRAILNDFLKDVKLGNRRPTKCPFHCINTCEQETSPYCISLALMNAYKGKLDNGFAFVGANGYKVKEIVSVKKLFEDLSKEYKECTD